MIGVTTCACGALRPIDSVCPECRTAPDRRKADDTGFDAAPARYMASGREAIDVIRDELGDQGCRAFCIGNQRKYELRAGHKTGVSADNDREKARWYRMFAAHIDGLGPDPRAGRKA